MIRFAKVLRTRLGASARTLLVQLRGLGSTGDDDGAEALDDVEVMQPLGLFSRPVIAAKLEALIAEIGEEVVALVLGNKSQSALDVEEGETRLYGAKESTCRIRMRADGSIDIEAKSATDIRLNGGSLKVARVTDPTTGHAHAAGAMVVVLPGPVVPPGTYPVTGASAVATDTIASSGGAARVKA